MIRLSHPMVVEVEPAAGAHQRPDRRTARPSDRQAQPEGPGGS